MSAPDTPFYPMTHDDAQAIIALLDALFPLGLVTPTKPGLLAPDAEAIEDGFIKEATPSNKGLMSAEHAALLANPAELIFTAGKSLTQKAGFHNSIFRGSSLGGSITAAQWAAISAGTFDDMFIGDFWFINSVKWRIAAFDYWLGCGDTQCTTHHVVIVPDTCLANCKMNNTDATTGAYVGSDWYTGNNSNAGKSTANAAINSAFGSEHILSHREYLKNVVSNGFESGAAWYNSTFELMTEQMVYGGKIYGNVMNGSTAPYSFTTDKSQLPLFAIAKEYILADDGWWLRDVARGTAFAQVSGHGSAGYFGASNVFGVRPAFGIIA